MVAVDLYAIYYVWIVVRNQRSSLSMYRKW